MRIFPPQISRTCHVLKCIDGLHFDLFSHRAPPVFASAVILSYLVPHVEPFQRSDDNIVDYYYAFIDIEYPFLFILRSVFI